MKPFLRAALLTNLTVFTMLAQTSQPTVEITQKPQGLVHGMLSVPVTVRQEIERVELVINGVKFAEARGRSVVFRVPVGEYIRRLRIRAVGYDSANQIRGEDAVIVNDPQPPFNVRLIGPAKLPENGQAELSASVTAPSSMQVNGVEFFVGSESIGVDTTAPYGASFDPSKFPGALFATATARAGGAPEAYDAFFWGSSPGEEIDVVLQQIPLSVAGAGAPPDVRSLKLVDNGKPRKIEALIPASDLPLSAIILLDSSESMLEELPLVKQAALEFIRSTIRPNDRYAVVAFAQQRVWLTPFTNNTALADRGLEQLRPRGQTHLYDAVIEMLYELQKLPGRRALIVLTDGVNQGGAFNLDHLVHYARYAGVPVYPVIRNTLLSRFMKFGLARFQANRFAAIARDSGATYFIVNKQSELPNVYRRISDELRQQRVLMFYSEGTGRDEWHSLALQAPKGQNLRIPRGYFP